MFNLSRLLPSRRKQAQYWSDTEINVPDTVDTVLLIDEPDRLAAAESEWMIDGLLFTESDTSKYQA